MTDTPPEFAEDARKCAGDSSCREAGGKDFAKQKAGEAITPPGLPLPETERVDFITEDCIQVA